MKPLTKIITTVIIMLLTGAFLSAEPLTQPLDEGRELYFKARDMMNNEETGYLDLLEKSKTAFNQIPDEAKKNYWLARLELSFGEYEMGQKNDKKAEKHFQQAMELINKSLKIEEASDSFRVLSDSYMYLMNYKGFLFQAKNGTKLKTLPEKALSLDPNNFAAMISLGLFHVNAPAIAGASKDKAVEFLKKASESSNSSEKFSSFVWLAQAYRKLKNKEEALKSIDKALEIYPNSKWAAQVKREILEDKDSEKK
jgi:tetratricopeptide (TPR) repeat protein